MKRYCLVVFGIFVILSLGFVSPVYSDFLDDLKKGVEDASKDFKKTFGGEKDSEGDKVETPSKDQKEPVVSNESEQTKEPQKNKLTRFSVDSNVDGATVLLNDKKIGQTPLKDFIIQPGECSIKVYKDGYEPYNKPFVFIKGKSISINVDLTKIDMTQGHLFVNTTPQKATVRILNIKPRFKQGIKLSPGKYHIAVSAPGFSTEKKWIQLQGGKDKTISVSLQPVSSKTVEKPSQQKKRTPKISDELRKELESLIKGFLTVLYGNSNYKKAPKYICKDLVNDNMKTMLQSQRRRKINLLVGDGGSIRTAYKYLDQAKLEFTYFNMTILKQTTTKIDAKYKAKFGTLLRDAETGHPIPIPIQENTEEVIFIKERGKWKLCLP